MKAKKQPITINLNVVNGCTFNGVIIESTLKETLKTNFKRVNPTTKEYYTATYIIFCYVGFNNETYLTNETSKDKYLKVAKNLLKELKSCGFEVGSDWLNNNKVPISDGNEKLSKYTKIINVAPSSLCVSKNNNRCKLCKVCYALSSERRYINTLIYRLTQLIRFEESTATDIINQLKRCKNKFLRFNESGDLFNESDLIKINKVAKGLYDLRGVQTYLYTHRKDLNGLVDKYQNEYLRINKSDEDFITVMEVCNHYNLFCDGNCNFCIYCKLQITTPILNLFHGALIGVDNRPPAVKIRDMIIKQTSFNMFLEGAPLEDINQFIEVSLIEGLEV